VNIQNNNKYYEVPYLAQESVFVEQANISSNTNVTKEQQQKTYAAFLIITGVDLAEILVSLNCNTQGLVTLADLLDVRKMFPNSYQTLTVPLYNAVPGPTNSKTYYPIFATNAVSSGLTAPAVVAQVGTVIPPVPPLVVQTPVAEPNYTAKEQRDVGHQRDVAAVAQLGLWQSTPAGPVGRNGEPIGAAYDPSVQQPFVRTFRG
jgi:hypothetical protein